MWPRRQGRRDTAPAEERLQKLEEVGDGFSPSESTALLTPGLQPSASHRRLQAS